MSAPKTSYRAEGRIRELRVNVCQYPTGTVISVAWATREKGDEPSQGHLWRFRHDSPKAIRDLGHAVSLALWAMRKVGSGEFERVR